jgi:hypothetical protein
MSLQNILAVASSLYSHGRPAYLDPGTGSYLIQLLIGGLVGILFLLRTYGRRIISFFKGLVSRPEAEERDD